MQTNILILIVDELYCKISKSQFVCITVHLGPERVETKGLCSYSLLLKSKRIEISKIDPT